MKKYAMPSSQTLINESIEVKFGCRLSLQQGQTAFGDIVSKTNWLIFKQRVTRPQTGTDIVSLFCPRCRKSFRVKILSHDSMRKIKKSRYIYAAAYALIAIISYMFRSVDLDGVMVFQIVMVLGVAGFLFNSVHLLPHLAIIMKDGQGVIHLTIDPNDKDYEKYHRLQEVGGQVRQTDLWGEDFVRRASKNPIWPW